MYLKRINELKEMLAAGVSWKDSIPPIALAETGKCGA